MHGCELYFIFSGHQLASVRAKHLYNLMNFCIHTKFFCQRINFMNTGGFSSSQLFTRLSNVFSINYAQISLYFILLSVIRYNRCRSSSNHLIWYHFKIVIPCSFDIRNLNAETGLQKWFDSAKIGMAGISEPVQFCTSFIFCKFPAI